ncbi:MAG: 4Fe-4S binding protein [Planctomycetota bacterium]
MTTCAHASAATRPPYRKLLQHLTIGAWRLLLLLGLFAVGLPLPAAQDPPELSDHALPLVDNPPPSQNWHQWLDIVVLALALGLAAWLILKRRSRRGVFWLMVGSLLYFGFYRGGCICPVGSVQNVGEGLFGFGVVVPLGVVLLFALPLIAALFWGRVFCGGVCPLGAMQDVVQYRPVKVPIWLQHVLGLLPYLYLGIVIMFAALGAGYLICRYDPFVAIWRFDGLEAIVLLTGVMMLLSLFVARPYCRFLCPYAVLLRLCSMVSRKHLSIYPDACIDCRLCEDACPYDAIRPAVHEDKGGPLARSKALFIVTCLLVPVLAGIGGFAISRLSGAVFSRAHPDVQLAETVAAIDAGRIQRSDLIQTEQQRLENWRERDHDYAALGDRAQAIYDRFVTGGWLVGIFFGLVVGIKLVSLCLRWRPKEYEPDRGSCLSCARCFDYCPGASGCDGDQSEEVRA